MISFVYVSSAVELFSPADLKALLETSRKNNSAAGITGILLYREGNFMQVLEGEEEVVRALHLKISGDLRHRGMMTLLEERIEERQFSGWSMAFRDLSSPEVAALPGFSEFLNTPLDAETFRGNPTRAQRLLLVFRRSMR